MSKFDNVVAILNLNSFDGAVSSADNCFCFVSAGDLRKSNVYSDFELSALVAVSTINDLFDGETIAVVIFIAGVGRIRFAFIVSAGVTGGGVVRVLEVQAFSLFVVVSVSVAVFIGTFFDDDFVNNKVTLIVINDFNDEFVLIGVFDQMIDSIVVSIVSNESCFFNVPLINTGASPFFASKDVSDGVAVSVNVLFFISSLGACGQVKGLSCDGNVSCKCSSAVDVCIGECEGCSCASRNCSALGNVQDLRDRGCSSFCSRSVFIFRSCKCHGNGQGSHHGQCYKHSEKFVEFLHCLNPPQ